MSNNIAELNMLISSVGLTQEPTFATIMYNNVSKVSTALLNITESKDREIKIWLHIIDLR